MKSTKLGICINNLRFSQVTVCCCSMRLLCKSRTRLYSPTPPSVRRKCFQIFASKTLYRKACTQHHQPIAKFPESMWYWPSRNKYLFINPKRRVSRL